MVVSSKWIRATNSSRKAIKSDIKGTKLPAKATNSYKSKFTWIETTMISTCYRESAS